MRYTLWYYAYDIKVGAMTKRYDILNGTRYACYVARSHYPFREQYKVHPAIW